MKNPYRTQTFATEHDGHRVELEWDPTLVVLNRIKLRIDGNVTDSTTAFYGTKSLRGQAGSETVTVEIHSGWRGQMSRCTLHAGSTTKELQPVD
jgi:hypothetical protein